MVAHLGAAIKFTEDHLDLPNNWAHVENSQVFYITGFFFTSCFNGAARIAKYAKDNDRIFCLNLSAPFVVQYFKKELVQILPYVDILFGNDSVIFEILKRIIILN